MELILIALGVTALPLGLHLLALFAEGRGLICYRTRPPRARTLGLFEELLDPRVEHRVEQETSEAMRADQSERGENYGGIDESD